MKARRSSIGTLLIANRGEIAVRLLSTCGKLGIRGVVVYSEADAQSLAVRLADEAILIRGSGTLSAGIPAPASQAYLDVDAILEAALRVKADAIHPGYGFFAENAEFARRVVEAGLLFVGPDADVIAKMGSKVAARELCQAAGVPTVPGSPALDDAGLLEWAKQHGYPVMLKASAGGGGKGMRKLFDQAALETAIPSARREAEKAFGSAELYLERALTQARHLEVQVACDRHGHHLHLGVRECSLQRRHQKILEECPPAAASPALLEAMTEAALKLTREVGYTNLGTIEFLASGDEFYFLEMNTRLQVEHPVTEAVTGLDLVEWQIAIAEGKALPVSQSEILFRGHAIEARVTCEDPSAGFLPATGPVLHWNPCFRARVDTGIESGGAISPHYDSMVAKIICWGEDRATALRRLRYSLGNTAFLGVRHNLDFLRTLLDLPAVQAGDFHTELVESLTFPRPPDTVGQLLVAAAARRSLESPLEATLGAFPFVIGFEGHPEVRVTGSTFALDGQTYQVETWPGGVTIDGHRFRATVAHQKDIWWVHTPDGTARLVALERHPVPAPKAAGGSLKAPMPGSVVEVLVEIGQSVAAGQVLLKLEAMKMEHLICAPAPGVVQSLPYAAGDQVEVGVELIGLGLDA